VPDNLLSTPTVEDHRHLKVLKLPSSSVNPRSEPPPPTGFHRLGPPPHALLMFTVLLGQSPLAALHRSFLDDRRRRCATPSSPHHRLASSVSPCIPPVARWVALTSPVLLPPLSPHLVPGSAASHHTVEATLGTVTAPGARSRHGMSRPGRYDFWARPTVSGHGPKARSSTITFFPFWFSFIKISEN
jgi:hypothetical protein